MQTGSLPQRLNAQLPVQPAPQQFAKRQRCSRPVRGQAAVLDKAATTLNTRESESVRLQMFLSLQITLQPERGHCRRLAAQASCCS